MKPQKLKIPAHLSPASKKLWKWSVENYDIDELSAPLLQDYIEAIERKDAARAIIAAEGENIKDRFGVSKAHPALSTLRDASTAMARNFRMLGLDQAPRGGGCR
jgi:phage terminase small subunit